jgi:hypothetical protein
MARKISIKLFAIAVALTPVVILSAQTASAFGGS